MVPNRNPLTCCCCLGWCKGVPASKFPIQVLQQYGVKFVDCSLYIHTFWTARGQTLVTVICREKSLKKLFHKQEDILPIALISSFLHLLIHILCCLPSPFIYSQYFSVKSEQFLTSKTSPSALVFKISTFGSTKQRVRIISQPH